MESMEMATIALEEPKIVYSPANWLVRPGSAKTANPDAYIRASITGGPTSLTATFDMSTINTIDPSQFGFRGDSGSWKIAPCTVSMPITMPTDSTWSTPC